MRAFGHGEHHRPFLAGETELLRGRNDGAVADQQHAIERIDGFRRLLGAAHQLDGDAVAAQALDRGGERGGQPLDEDDDGIGAGGGGEPRLPLDHRAAGKRQGRAQMPGLARFMICRNQRRERHV
ncbi:hypothetical protein [Allosphingosinicella sp.]|uniref:hypothetical protein n=1 Tax=Allosphingosinicella sp. TaxID=2823234 RepID=UPI003782D992